MLKKIDYKFKDKKNKMKYTIHFQSEKEVKNLIIKVKDLKELQYSSCITNIKLKK